MSDDTDKDRLDAAREAVLQQTTKGKGNGSASAAHDDGISATLRQKIGIPNPGNADEALLTKQWSNHVAKRYEGLEGRTYPLELPSGLMVEAKRANIFLLLRFGRVPDAITPVVSWMIEEIEDGGVARLNRAIQKREDDPVDRIKLNMEMIALFDYLWLTCVVTPRFTDRMNETNDTTFHVSDVEIKDKEFFYQWSQGVDVNVREFRSEEQTALMGALSALGNVRDEAE